MTVTFVCTGNTCRSPILYFLFQKYVKMQNESITILSAGLTKQICPMAENAVAALNLHELKNAIVGLNFNDLKSSIVGLNFHQHKNAKEALKLHGAKNTISVSLKNEYIQHGDFFSAKTVSICTATAKNSGICNLNADKHLSDCEYENTESVSDGILRIDKNTKCVVVCDRLELDTSMSDVDMSDVDMAENKSISDVDLSENESISDVDLSENESISDVDMSENKSISDVDMSESESKFEHVSKFCSQEIFNASDFIFTFEEAQSRILKTLYGENKKIVCLSMFNDKRDIPDPFGQDLSVYEMLVQNLKAIIPKVYDFIKQ